VGETLATKTSSRSGPTGILPHVVRLVRSFASARGVKGLVGEARSLGTHIIRYPLGVVPVPVRDNGTSASRRRVHQTPVVLVHGYFHNRSGFDFMSRDLRTRGFRWVHGMNYNPIRSSVPDLAERFAVSVRDVMEVSGANRVHVVGHSLGGLVVRWFVQELGGDEVVQTCVTIGTPHHGTYPAYLGLGPAARDMRPDSDVLTRLEQRFRRFSHIRFVNLYSDLDVLIIPPSSAVLPERPNVHNHLIEDLGHTSLLLSPVLIEEVCDHLEGKHNIAKAKGLSESA
jgi:triacylglycerol esterase/lipase EstA (alpha/beta hydrolase family)